MISVPDPMIRLAVVTPAYNRAEKLPDLYRSLCGQTDKRFIWLIVDDGSTDGTEAQISAFRRDGFDIHILRKENGGKHTAVNTAIKALEGSGIDLVFIVDSDDILTPDACETIYSYAAKYEPDRARLNLAGFSFLRKNSKGEINAGCFPRDEWVASYCEARINSERHLGDKAEVFWLDVLAGHPFPVFAGERFFPEDALWIVISGPCNMVHINKAIYICEYLEGGLTKSGRKMKLKSPFGMMYRSKAYLDNPDVNRLTRLKMLVLYRIYELAAKDEGKVIPESAVIRKSLFYHLLFLPAYLLYRRWDKN